jgi:protein TonB
MSQVSQLLETRRARVGRWVGAALIVCALHAGAFALALMQPHQEEDEDAAGALSVELAPVPPAPVPVKSPDLPPGPEQEEAKLTPEASKEVAKEVREDVPPVDPSPAPEPEVALPKPQPEEKEQPKPEEIKEAAKDTQAPQQDRDVAVSTAPPRMDAPPAPSVAPSPVPSPSLARAKAAWEKALFRQLERYKTDPSTKWAGMKGRVVVRFKMDESGQLLSSEITQSSGSPLLDDAALRLLKRASPFPRPPPGVLLDYNLPITLER